MTALGHHKGTLAERLAAVCGAVNVLTGADMDRYARDWRGNHASHPVAVARPGSTAEAAEVLCLATEAGVPVVPMSGNTGLVGGTRTEGGLIVSLERMTAVRALDVTGRSVAVDAGIVIDALDAHLAPHGLRFPLSFGAKGSAMIGGALSTNAGGSNVLAFGMARALCLGLEVVLPDGRVLDDMTALRKDNTGYDLKQLFIGAEGTLGLITGAVLSLTERPVAQATALIAVGTLSDGLAVLDRLRRAFGPMLEAFEVMPRSYLEQAARCGITPALPFDTIPVAAILIELASAAEDDGATLTDRLSRSLGACLEDDLLVDAVIAQSERQCADLWHLREIAAELGRDLAPVMAADVSVPLSRIDGFEAVLVDAIRRLDPNVIVWTVGHLGDGNLHIVAATGNTSPDHHARLRAAVDAEVMAVGGSFSAEHGVGVQKLASMGAHKNAVALDLMATIKAALDPRGLMNPGKVLPADTLSRFGRPAP